MTFEQWQATRVWSDDLRPYSQEDSLQQGYVYHNERFIVSSGGCYSLILGNEEYESVRIEEIEATLYEWCVSAGDFE